MEDQKYILQEILHIAQTHQVDAIVLAGDIYDKSTPSAEATALVSWFFEEISSHKIPLIAIPGNHDSAERVGYLSGVLRNQGLFIAPSFQGKIHSVELTDEYGPIVFWLFPFVKPAHVRPYFPEAEIESYDDAMRVLIKNCDINENKRNVALVHQFITAGSKNPERSDSELVIGGLDNIDVSAFDAFDYVALGHIHKPQRVGREEVRYCGTPLKYSLSEIYHHKSVPLVSLQEKGLVKLNLIPLKPLHDVRKIEGPLKELISDEVCADQNCTDYIHACLTDDYLPLNAQSVLREHYPNLISLELKQRNHEVNNPLAEKHELSQKSALELFEEFYKSQNSQELNSEEKDLVISAFEKSQE